MPQSSKKNQSKTKKSQSSEQMQNKLRAQLEQIQDQLNRVQEKEKRSLADYQNLLRRTNEDRAKIAKFANKDLIQALLPVAENLDRAAIQFADEGLSLVIKQLWQVLAEFGVERIEADGQKFDIETMEAIDANGEGDTVTAIIQHGYKLKGEVIQHTKVVLGKP
jgi:molecular chaperone GrpE